MVTLEGLEQFHQGIQCLNQGKPTEAEPYFRAAVRECPDWPEAHHHLGLALAARGQQSDALECFQRACQLQPEYADAHFHLANVLRFSGQTTEAVTHYREAVRIQPNWADAHSNLGLTLRTLGEFDEALQAFRQALRANPQHIDARNNLGVTLADKGLLQEAAATYRLVLQTKPQFVETNNNLGVVLAQQGNAAEAIQHYRRALELRPDYAEAHNNLGNALRQDGQLQEAENCLRKAIQLKPDYAEAYNNLAIVLVKQERMEEAIAYYLQALRLKPNYPDAQKNLGLAHLGVGNYAEGWKENEYRWQTKEMPARVYPQPRWDGSPLEGKTILVYAEQGLGDTLQFVRFAPLVEERGGRVVLECQKPLLGLLRDAPGVFRLVTPEDGLPEFDTHIPLMSLPYVFGTTLESIPAKVPYLKAEPERLRKWSKELKGITGFKIGIAWQGSIQFKEDRFRSIPLGHFEPIARLPRVRLISLQKFFGSEQLRHMKDWKVSDFGDKLDAQGAFLDTAAIMKHLDLVVTSDTAIAHLAGALGVKVWLAVSKAPDWRWLLQGESNSWYPTMRLFRQKQAGNWKEVFERIAGELEMCPELETAERHGQRALALLNQGKPAEAATAFQRALDLEPGQANLHHDLAVALERAGKIPEAIASYREAVRHKPDFGEALHHLGNLLRHQNRPAEAEAEYRKALTWLSDSPELCNHLGIALLAQAKHAEAEKWFRRSLRLQPNNAHAHNNLGVLHEQMGNVDEAIACYQEALRLQPEGPDFHKNLALGWLMRGDYARGWAEYEWRWKNPANPPRHFTQPRYDGRFLHGQAVLLYAEQGLGDTIQFVRYAALVQQRGGVVFVECPGILINLLSRCPGIDRLFSQKASLPDFAFQAPFLSLPGIFHTTLETVPAEVPYLSAEPQRIDTWGKELESVPGFKIGIAWQGSKTYPGDAHRSIPLKEFEPLATLPGVRLISLQKGHGTEQLKEWGARWNVVELGERLDAEGAFVDTAAVMMHLDLMVTSDTAVAHLAGALGIPVWMPLSLAADWRWLCEGDRSPWYPTMRLFRQTSWGDWGEVFQRMAQELRLTRLCQAPVIPTEIAPGELLDRITILEIKRSRIRDEKKLDNVRVELGSLVAARTRCLRPSRELDQLTGQLKTVNETLWQIEDDIRLQEQRQDFDERFIELARSVYVTNDRRADIKRAINQLLGSPIVEEKSYARDQQALARECQTI